MCGHSRDEASLVAPSAARSCYQQSVLRTAISAKVQYEGPGFLNGREDWRGNAALAGWLVWFVTSMFQILVANKGRDRNPYYRLILRIKVAAPPN